MWILASRIGNLIKKNTKTMLRLTLMMGLLWISAMGCQSSSTTVSKPKTTIQDTHKGEREFQAYLDRKRSGFIGQKAPDVTLTTLSGKTVNPAKMKGKLVLLNFWFAACKPCITEIPSLNELQKKYKKDQLVVLSVSTDRKSVVEAVAEKYNKQYLVVADGKALAERLKVVTFPTSFLIDQEGIIHQVFIGASADDATYTYSEIKPHIEELLR